MDGPEDFEAHRGTMFALAYRMLGSAADAEDVVQDAYLRYRGAPAEEVRSARALLGTIVTRLCLNRLDSARARREVYVGPWLPEPILTAQEADAPSARVELLESVSLAFLVLLETLTPAERAVFLLREVFDVPYGEIAEMVGKDEAACRQLCSRAARHVAAHRPRFRATAEEHRRALGRFMDAVQSGSRGALRALLADDVTLWADGGGKVPGAATRPLHGADAVSQFVIASTRFLAAGAATEIAEVNGAPAAIVRAGDAIAFVIALDVRGDRVAAVRVVANPDKLRGLA